jgi:hypothetical protein
MAETQQDIGTIEPYHEGDSLEVIVSVDEDGADKDLSQATVSWTVAHRSGATPTLADTDSGVSASVTDAATGEVTVTIDSGVTDGLAGRYQHELRVTDLNGDTAVVAEGRFRIAERVTP